MEGCVGLSESGEPFWCFGPIVEGETEGLLDLSGETTLGSSDGECTPPHSRAPLSSGGRLCSPPPGVGPFTQDLDHIRGFGLGEDPTCEEPTSALRTD